MSSDFGTRGEWRRRALISERHLHNETIWVPAIVNNVITPLTGIAADVFGGRVPIINPTVEPYIDLRRMLLCNPVGGQPIPADGAYHVEICIGDARITEIEFYLDTAVGNNFPRCEQEVRCPRIPAGSIVQCRAKCSNPGGIPQALELRFGYHPYPW